MDIVTKEYEGGDSQIVLYQPNETISIEVKLDAEYDTVWLTQAQMVELFATSKANISEHIRNIFQQNELQPESTVRKFRIVRKDSHDRWLVIDDKLYHCGHSLNANGGHKISAITLIGTSPEVILGQVR